MTKLIGLHVLAQKSNTSSLKKKKRRHIRLHIELFTLVTSNFLVIILDDMSHTNGTPFVSGMKGNSTPVKVLKKSLISEL